MLLRFVSIVCFLMSSAAFSYPDPIRSSCAILFEGAVEWPNFKDPKPRANAIETLGLTRFANNEDPLRSMLNSISSKGNPNYAPTRKEMYYDLLKRFGYVIKHGNGAKFFHGSSSGSLISVIATETGPQGLVPSGKLLKQGKVPFSGELLPGISKNGVNHHSLSVTTFTFLDLAFQYAMSSPYSPELGKKSIAKYSELLNQFRDSNDNRMVEAVSLRIEIEQNRIAGWNQMNPVEKTLIERGFPVLYGIKKPSGEKPVRTINTWETLIPDGVKPQEIVSIFVPIDQVEFIRSKLTPDNDIEVSPIEPALRQAKSVNDFRNVFSTGFADGD